MSHPTAPAAGRPGSGRDTAAKPIALALWVVVGAGLVYGVTETMIKVVQLFTG